VDLPRLVQFAAHEREPAQLITELAFGPDVRFEPLSRAFAWKGEIIDLGPVALLPHAFSGGMSLSGTVSATIVALMTSPGQAAGRMGARAGSAERDRHALVYSANHTGAWRCDGDFRPGGVGFDPEFLRRQLELLTGETVPRPPVFELEMATERGPGALFERLVRDLLEMLPHQPDSLSQARLGDSLCEVLARALLVGHRHDFSHLVARPARRVDEAAVRQIEEYAEAHADRPIRPSELAQRLGVGTRMIEAAFQDRRGTTLEAFLHRTRLERIRRALLGDDPTLTPERASHRAGYLCRERFGADYQRAFHERPEATWDRGRDIRSRRGVDAGAAPTVFLVCGDPALWSPLLDSLQRAGHRVEIFDSMQSLVRADLRERSGCVLLDLALADHDRVAGECPRLPRIGLNSRADIRAAVEAMKDGALDVLIAPFDEPALLGAIERAFVQDAVQRRLATDHAERTARRAALSPRELAVCEFVARGLLNKQIAAELGISEATVRVHRARGMDKLGAKSAAELGRLLARDGEARVGQ